MVTRPMSDAQTYVKRYNDWQSGRIPYGDFIKIVCSFKALTPEDFHESGWIRYRFSDGSWGVIAPSNNGLNRRWMYVPVDGLIFQK